MVLNDIHKRVLRHTLGMERDGDDAYRNHFVAGEGHADMPHLNELLVAGYVVVRDNPGGSGFLFRTTEKGRKAVDAGAKKPLPAQHERGE